ncbi:Acyl transferase/acyl hydrolase/lysophospholipase [Penicillium mononematosum]|uniref:Acyl transferase/acyl hydrolase/lysophospholipase n=1 Tax=Penicillium mononematosum TaxID=268346 RepID=UPI0025477C14|nr:Acyl transferase/acyl hydrolase/lysophospholipase [Penicillium mononematosum]KAJ6191690.1 Acyl transferase/acyl hydrolase/lysophospholipase [Penicillium mononematosum]
MMYRMSHVGFLSPDSICRSFDHRANGYARREGVGTLILKSVSDAIRDADTMRAVVRGTGSNQNGHTPGMPVPGYKRQEQLIRSVYAQSGLKLEETAYVCRGSWYGDAVVGAVKSVIGHLEGASGLAGLIKTVFVLERGIIPPNVKFEGVNPKIPAEKRHFQFPQVVMPRPGPGLRRAFVSSFGSRKEQLLRDAEPSVDQPDLSQDVSTVIQTSLIDLLCQKNFHPHTKWLVVLRGEMPRPTV